VPIKGASGLFPLAFYLAVTVVVCYNGGQRGISKDYKESCGKHQVHTGRNHDTKSEAIQIGTNPLSGGSSIQNSSTDMDTGPNPPPIKKTRVEDDEGNSEEEAEMDMPEGPIIPISEEAATFLEVSFSMKLEKKS